MYVGKVRAYLVTLFNCTEGVQQAAGLWNAYTEGRPNRGRLIENGYMNQYAQNVGGIMFPDVSNSVRNTIYAGHSQGGAIAYLSALLRYRGYNTPETTVVSFGAPKAGGDSIANSGRGMSLCRWMNDTDPIPVFPPSSLLGTQLAALGSATVAGRLAEFSHHRGGVVINANGEFSVSVVPPAATLPAIGNFAGWLLNADREAVEGHRLATYIARLQRVVDRNPPPSQMRPAEAPAERYLRVNNRELTAQQRVGVQTIFNVGEAQQVEPLVVPANRPFTAYRLGRVWYVAFGDQTIAIGPTKKRALRMKNFGNEWLKRMQRSAYVDVQTLINQMTPYFEAASTPGSGFTPTLRVTLP
jgi:hypothetical protein